MSLEEVECTFGHTFREAFQSTGRSTTIPHMGAAFVLMEPKSLVVNPGEQRSIQVSVRNVGNVVDVLRLEALGQSSRWVEIEPRELRLLPGADGVATVTFHPPRDASVAAGRTPFAVRATSAQEGNATVEEGQVEVLPFLSVVAEMVPHTVRGRRRARTELAVDNRGNVGIDLTAAGGDADGAVEVDVRDRQIRCDPGAAVLTRVDIRPVSTFWRGPVKTLPFKIDLSDTGGNTRSVEGAVVQEPLLPKWFVKAVVGALLAVLALVILWFTLLRPAVESSAGEAAEKEVQSQAAGIKADAVEAAKAATAAGGSGAGRTQEAVEQAAESAAQTQIDEALEAGTFVAKGDPIDFRLDIDPATSDAATRSFVGRVFSMTDVVLQNPRGDKGTIRIRRGADIVLEVGLENFRDLDYHYVTPLVFDGVDLRIDVDCRNEAGPCTPAVSFGGFVKPE